MKTRITELLGIKYPIIQGGMQNVAYPQLCAAVSAAGGLGTVNTTIYPDFDDFRNALKEVKSLTDKPFCVNMSLLPDANVGDGVKRYIDICAEEGVKAIETAGTKPDALVSLIKGAGIVYIHKVPATRFALSAERCGVDAVTCVGFECAGHPGADNIGAIVLINEATHKCKIPVIAGGGIVDGYGMAAAFALGAEAVIMGTRFLATEEAPISRQHKLWLLSATERDTVIAQRSIHNQVRVAKNGAAKKCLELEAQGATLKELLAVIGGAKGKAAYESGDVDGGMYPVGVGCSLIKEIKPAAQVVEETMREMETTAKRLNGYFG
jgi:Dioxygenases related to 2-nitropropane dioxygenase